jgi:primosomal protein N' (replication factor Y)
MAEDSIILRVAIPRPFHQLLDYQISGEVLPVPGCRVRVPLGGSSAVGIVISQREASDIENLKSVDKVIDSEPLLPGDTLELLQWASRYYHHPIGEVCQNAIPVSLRGERQAPKMQIWYACSSDKNVTGDAMSDAVSKKLSRSPRQRELFRAVYDSPKGMTEQEIRVQFGSGGKNLLKQLKKKGVVAAVDKSEIPESSSRLVKSVTGFQLTDEQVDCLAKVNDINNNKPSAILLHGITGSGKTEIYLRALEPVLEKGRQALVIVPEIGLTPQLLKRFEVHFPQHRIAVLHSGLAGGERMHAWLAAKAGIADILIGTRSAVFTPIKNLGMIIVDEEHDTSLKQQEGFRYHARDLAVKRAHDLGVSIIMGSATPSLESLYNVERGQYHYLRLNRRPGSIVPPTIALHDIRGLSVEAGIAPPLLKEIRQHLQQGNQVMLFLNRRGFAPAMFCPQCGWHAQCQRCDANMTYHASQQKLICHHCDNEQSAVMKCPSCGNVHITTKGQGTERVERVLQGYFPNYPVVRIDRDTTRRKGQLQGKLEELRKGEPTILIGTQMLAKGHDFPDITLVGILDVDQSLFSTDFRAWERLAQLIIQVAGRAGRAEKKGHVILQTTQPEHPLFHTLLSKGYPAIARQVLEERSNWHFPPYAHQVLIRSNAPEMQHALAFLEQVRGSIEGRQSSDMGLLGPAPSPIEKRSDRYRAQLLITASKRTELHALLDHIVSRSKDYKKKGKVRWSIDVDPMDYT